MAMRNVGVLSCWVWCLIAPSRGGVPLLGETRSAELTLGETRVYFTALSLRTRTPRPPLGVRALLPVARSQVSVANCELQLGFWVRAS